VKEIAAGVYVEDRFAGGAVGLISSEKGHVLVDTPMLPSEAREWRMAIMQISDAPICGIVNTDYHPEHFLGNAYIGPARSYGHAASGKPLTKYPTTLEQLASAYRETMPDVAQEIAETTVVRPEVCVDSEVTLHLGDRRIEILALDGHTPASLGVLLPEERILFAGDTLTDNEHPAMYQANTLAWIDTLERVKTMEVDTLVTGKGALVDKSVIDPLIAYITEMHRRVSDMFAGGASRRECVDKIGMLDFFPFDDDEATAVRKRRRGNVERVYTEIRIASKKKRRA